MATAKKAPAKKVQAKKAPAKKAATKKAVAKRATASKTPTKRTAARKTPHTVMSDRPPCPHCGRYELGYDAAWGRRMAAMAGEIMQPWKLVWNTVSPLFRQAVQEMEVVRKDYRCNSCHKRAFICPSCERASKLYKGPTQAEVVTCTECSKEAVFRLD